MAGMRTDARARITQLAQFRELQLSLWLLEQAISEAGSTAAAKRPSDMTRLERSLASGRVPRLMKDSTQPLGVFLFNSCQAINEFILQLDPELLDNMDAAQMVRVILDFCWDVFCFSHGDDFDDGVFHTYLQIGQTLTSRLRNSPSDLPSAVNQSLQVFNTNWSLSTGQSMQRMWEDWRPATPLDPGHLQFVIGLRNVASRFDNVIVKTRLPLSQLSQLRNSLLEAQVSTLKGAHGTRLVQVCLAIARS